MFNWIKSQNVFTLLLGGAGAILVVFLALAIFSDTGVTDTDYDREEPLTIEKQNSETIAVLFGMEESEAEKQARFEAELNELDPPHPHNPINPATQAPYTNRDMQKFEELKSIFPENRVIPKRRTPEEQQAHKKLEDKLAVKFYENVRIQVLKGELDQDEIDEYFTYRTRYTRDKIRLFQYALDNLPPDADPARRRRMEKLLESNEKKMARAQKQKEDAYAKAGITATASIW
jgi:hypothetical protein